MLKKSCFVVMAVLSVMNVPVSAELNALSADVVIGTGIENRQPVGAAEKFASNTVELVGWSKITGAENPTTVTHVWIHAGKEVARIELAVKSKNYRTWSRVPVAQRIGNWLFQVVDSLGNTVSSKTIEVLPN